MKKLALLAAVMTILAVFAATIVWSDAVIWGASPQRVLAGDQIIWGE
jgi:hypothetical protein